MCLFLFLLGQSLEDPKGKHRGERGQSDEGCARARRDWEQNKRQDDTVVDYLELHHHHPFVWRTSR